LWTPTSSSTTSSVRFENPENPFAKITPPEGFQPTLVSSFPKEKRNRLPKVPVLSDGRAVEEAIRGTTGEARWSLILASMGLTHRDMIPWPTLDKDDPKILDKVDAELFLTDFRYACESFIWIRTKGRAIEPFKLNIAQIYFLLHRWGRDILLKARQHGFTTFLLAYYLWDTMTTPATTTFVIAHEKQAGEECLQTMRMMYECFPKALRPRLRRDKIGMMVFDAIGSSIQVVIVDDASGRSYTCNNLFCTEVSSWKIDEEALQGLLNSVPQHSGSVTMESTPRGVGNYFHRACSEARLEGGESQYKFFELPYYLNPEYDDAWVAFKKSEMNFEKSDEGKRAWYQEYCCSFEQSQRCFFEKNHCTPRSPKRVRQEQDPKGNSYPRWAYIYEEPEPGERYVLGADTSQGKEDGDWNCGSVMSRKRRREVATLYSRMKPEDFALALNWLARKYNYALLGPEANNSGFVVLHILWSQLFYPNLFFHPNEYNPRAAEGMGQLGWQTNRRTRPQMLHGLRQACAENSIELAFAPRQTEMEVFRLDDQGRPEHPPGFHDDTIITAAIAHRLLDFPDMMIEEDITLSVEAYGG